MLTRRGRAVVGVAGAAVLLALTFGERSLNAVVAPAVVVLAAGYVQVATTPEVVAERTPSEDAHVGETRRVELTFARRDGELIDRPFPGDVTELVAGGVRPIPAEDGGTVAQRADGDTEISVETAVGSGPVHYDVCYETRGRHTLGPATVTATDAFGLFARETELRGTDAVLAYPRVRRLSPVGRRSLGRLADFGRSDRRGEFAELREYVAGDPLRDINWKTTAKRDELIVTEFAAETDVEAVSVAAGANSEGADMMAEAVASVVSSLVADGVPVELSLPRGELRVGPEYGGERAMLRTLATVAAGPVPDGEADVVIKGTAEDATVDVRGSQYRFSELVAGGSVGDDAAEVPTGVAA
ncbi:hypothetical protein JCM30237_01570 [Halolamina litorea]|uniref:DUF58 domain-containing protein n=1 Tax=Halolamina litorea TaxID=1515593 RepID=A0ABD6BTE0_9EURY|nr:DUF58 domain-containing protein [Halolamina litorea]